MGDILGGGLILTLGSFMIVLAGLDTSSAYGGIGFKPRSNGRDPCRADADPGLRWDNAARQGDASLRRQSSACVELGGLLEPSAPLSVAAFFILLLVETDRMPIHSSTHIEVYMIDEEGSWNIPAPCWLSSNGRRR